MMPISRRHFLAQAAAATAAVASPSRRASASPNERVHLALIGVRGMGFGHLQSFMGMPDAVVATVCDIDESVLNRATQTVRDATKKQPKMVGDFRRVLDDKSIDAVVIATPHHWHTPIAVPAMQAGKDVYVEKPGSHVFRE